MRRSHGAAGPGSRPGKHRAIPAPSRSLVAAVIGVSCASTALRPHKVSLGLGNVFVSQARHENVDVRPGLPARYVLDVALSVNDVLREGLRFQLIAQNIVGTRYADPLSGYLGVREDYPRGGRQIVLSIGWSEPSAGQGR